MSKPKGKKSKPTVEEGTGVAEAAGEVIPETAGESPEGVEAAPAEALAASQEEARKNWDLYLRERADLENYRKRAQREKEELAKFANENLLREILPVMDNLSRAVEHARKQETGTDGLLEGVEMTLAQFGKALERFGVKTIVAVGEPFDPARHEAMGQIESADQPSNTVIQELQKGYLLNDRLLRPALVMIAKAPAAPSSPSGE